MKPFVRESAGGHGQPPLSDPAKFAQLMTLMLPSLLEESAKAGFAIPAHNAALIERYFNTMSLWPKWAKPVEAGG
jgi:hypothetical protein